MHPDTIPDARRPPRWIWVLGQQRFCMVELARRRRTSRQAAQQWAERHPDLCTTIAGHTYAPHIEGSRS